jgi:hypothetical protein
MIRPFTGVFLLVPLLFFVSCGKRNERISPHNLPADSIIPRYEMVKIIADIHVLEASLAAIRKKGDKEQVRTVFYYSRLFSNYHVSEKRFHANLEAYLEKPDQFHELYDEVIKELDSRLRLQKIGNLKMK